ncbi:MAG: nicotinate-nucleotide adenylyltransferase [Lachnospiraceae bacterium]|jgi:nicotinate-nucleotide adenylyltransferase|nr:nicotinate-nucleotide adenylyltransferase [Lachnospiraceae bacterium]
MKKIGIMGGTFNPIHIGHLMLAEWARDALALSEVWFIPTGGSYMKDSHDILPGRERLHMAELAIRDNACFKCLDLEIVRGGNTYSYETIEELKRRYPQNAFFFIAGADCLFTIEHWKNPERLLNQCTFVAAIRGDIEISEMELKKKELERRFCVNGSEIFLLPFINMSVSSTQIRARIHDGHSIQYLVPDNVITYIEEKEFYREKRDSFKKTQKSDEKGTG